MAAAETLTQDQLQAEYDRAVAFLDRAGVPRRDDHDQPLGLALRIAVLVDQSSPSEGSGGPR